MEEPKSQFDKLKFFSSLSDEEKEELCRKHCKDKARKLHEQPDIPEYDEEQDKKFYSKRPSNARIINAFNHSAGIMLEAAKILKVHRSTIYQWIQDDLAIGNNELDEALKMARDIGVDIAENALIKRMKGYDAPETKVFFNKDTGIVREDMIKHYPPDVRAAEVYLWANAKHLGYGVKELPQDGGEDQVTVYEMPDNGRDKKKDNSGQPGKSKKDTK